MKQLKSALPVVWRNPDTVQIGLAGRGPYAVVSGLGPSEILTMNYLIRGARTKGRTEISTHLIELLQQAGVLAETDELHQSTSRDLHQEISLCALLYPHHEPSQNIVSARAEAWVALLAEGSWRKELSMLLRRAGVGRVDAITSPADIAHLKSNLSEDAPWHRGPIVVSVHDIVMPAVLADRLSHLATGHVPIVRYPTQLTIGPTMGSSELPCLSCLDLFLGKNDAAWPVVRSQLQPTAQPSTAAVSSYLVSAAALDILRRIDQPRKANTQQLVLDLSDGTSYSRTISPHPQCPCQKAHHQISSVSQSVNSRY